MNNLNQDLTGKAVIVKQEFFARQRPTSERLFVCKGGFGCLGFTIGRKICGHWLDTEEVDVISGMDVEMLFEPDPPRETRESLLGESDAEPGNPG